MPKRDFLKISDLSATEVADLYNMAAAMKSGEYTDRPLEGHGRSGGLHTGSGNDRFTGRSTRLHGLYGSNTFMIIHQNAFAGRSQNEIAGEVDLVELFDIGFKMRYREVSVFKGSGQSSTQDNH